MPSSSIENMIPNLPETWLAKPENIKLAQSIEDAVKYIERLQKAIKETIKAIEAGEEVRNKPSCNVDKIYCQQFGEAFVKYLKDAINNQKPMTNEPVLCFERKLLDDLGVFQGLSTDLEKYFPVVTSDRNVIYLNRDEAEENKRFKQLIPYVIILCGDKILRYRRGKSGGEKRLHDLYSVGIGGHISRKDGSSIAGYQEGMRREVMEEVSIQQVNANAVALINDDSTEVGSVHFGVVHVIRVDSESITNESDIADPEFVTFDQATEDLAVYESWSRFCLEQLDSLVAKA